jgi:ABC-type transport system substrate-binding protein
VLPFGPAMYGENASQWRQYLASAPAYDYDLAKARQFLAQSAYPQGFNCVLITSENSLVGQRALFLQEALKALNINVEIKKMSGDEQDVYQLGEVLDKNGKRDYDILFGGLEADYPDVNGLIELFFASDYVEGGYNSAAYNNPVVDALINEQRSTIENAKRFDIQKRLVDIVVNDVPYIVFDYSKRHSALSNKYTGIAVTPAWQWVLPIQDVRLAK